MIPFFDYRPEYRRLRTDLDQAIARVLASGRLILGPEVEAFEREMAELAGAAHGVGVASGTDAIVLALRVLGVGAGDEVITVANAGAPPVAAIRAAGATPRFVDVEPGTLLMDPGALEAAIGERARAILPVHLYGQPAPLDEILAIAGRCGLPVVEDCAQAHGATYRGRPVGGQGRIGCFSFYPTKNLGAYGDGGMCVTGDAALAESLREQRMYGFRGDRESHVEGLNSRLDELQAAVLRVKLRSLAATNEERRHLAARYARGLAETAWRPVESAPGRGHVWHLHVVRGPGRERAMGALEAAGIGCGVHYPVAAHLMEAWRASGPGPGALPVTERACAQVLSLPLWPGLGERAVDEVVRALARAG